MRRVLTWVLFGVLLAGAVWPVPRVRAQPAQTDAHPKFEQGRLGVELRPLDDNEIKALGLTQARALLVELPAPGGPAARAGVRPGDVIVELEGAAVGTIEDFTAAVQSLGAGKTVTLALLRSGQRLAAQATLVRSADIPEEPEEENLERHIAANEAISRSFSRETFPHQWALAQLRLGRAYLARQRGDQGDNFEKAIAALEATLTVFARESEPKLWAVVQHELGRTYEDRTRGDSAANMERAIGAYDAALTVFTHEAWPLMWAKTQSHRAVAYRNRVHGDWADNMEKALGGFEAALKVFTYEAQPGLWAQTQMNLGNVYVDRIHGDHAENVEKGIAHLQAALTRTRREDAPHDWALLQHNLGGAYWQRVRGGRADNMEKALAASEAALTIYTRKDSPLRWAHTQMLIALVYRDRIRSERADNLEKAIGALEAALTVRTKDLPLEWAKTQQELGQTYQLRIRGGQTGNLKKAVGSFEAALTVLGRNERPRDHLRVSRRLGEAYIELGEWRKAGLTHASAREAFLLRFGEGLNESEARDLIADAGPLFSEAAFTAAQLGESERALALASEGRARMMAVALKLQTLQLPADKRRRLEELRAEIRVADRAAEATQGTERAAAVEKLVGLRQEVLGLVKEADAAGSAAHTSALAEARVLTGKGGAVVVPIVTRFGGRILIAMSGSDPASLTPFDLPELTMERVDALIRGGDKTGGWLAAYRINHLPETEQIRRWPDWLTAVNGLGPELWRLLGGRLDAALKEAGVKRGARIIWMPTGALGILPLGLAQDPKSGRRLTDDYEIVYAPSLQALTTARSRIAKAEPGTTLGLIVNPTGDLPGAEKEGKVVASHVRVAARTVKARGDATPTAVLAALKGKSYWHFASHGTFSWKDARESGLYMAGPKVLTVGKLLEADGLGQPRLVVLSACETGLYDIDHNPDEFIGLPGTFMALGAAGVVGTLWPVNDAATALLVAKFYELHLGEGFAPPTALWRAQLWLRQATSADLRAYARRAARQGRLESRHLAELEADLSEEGLNRSRNVAAIHWFGPEAEAERAPGKAARAGTTRRVRPYAHPYFWAGFIYTGL